MSVNRVLLVVALQLVAVLASNDTNNTNNTITAAPTVAPTAAVGNSTVAPTAPPTKAPTAAVVNSTVAPTAAPTKAPTAAPTAAAGGGNGTASPTVAPTKAPTAASGNSTASPTGAPTQKATPAPTAAPTASGNSTPAPTAAPKAAEVTVVVIETTVAGVDFAQLSSNATLLAGFKSSVASTFATIAKVPASSIKITLSSGSVKVKAEITPAAGTTAASLSSTMSAQTKQIASNMVTSLKALPGLAAVTSGTLSVSDPVFTTKTAGGASNATTTAELGEVASGAADVKPAMSAMAMVMAAVYGAYVM